MLQCYSQQQLFFAPAISWLPAHDKGYLTVLVVLASTNWCVAACCATVELNRRSQFD
jgi:hypothetical protein